LFELLTKDDVFCTNQFHNYFESLKRKHYVAPVLQGPNWSHPFHISTNASYTSIGAILGQKEYHKPYSIYFISKKLTPIELNFIVTKKNIIVVVHAINKYRHYITSYEVSIHNNHSAI
jgi:hypothetical protein